MKAPINEPRTPLNNNPTKTLKTAVSHKHKINSTSKSLRQRHRLPARSIKEIRRRQLGDTYQSPLERIVYALLNGLLYGFVGLFIDLSIVVIRSLFNVGSGEVFWLFTPFMLLLGIIIGFITGKNAGADGMDALPIEMSSHLNHIDDYSIRHDIFRGLGTGIFIFAIIWLIMMVAM